MGWSHVNGSIGDPVTGRSSFSEVLQEGVLRRKLRKLNLWDGQHWLDMAWVGCIAWVRALRPWKIVKVAAAPGRSELSEQECLVIGMLEGANLLDLIRHYMQYLQVGWQTVRALCRAPSGRWALTTCDLVGVKLF